MLSKGVDVDPVNYRGTPLHLAAAKDRDQVVKILLEHGADVSCCCFLIALLLMDWTGIGGKFCFPNCQIVRFPNGPQNT